MRTCKDCILSESCKYMKKYTSNICNNFVDKKERLEVLKAIQRVKKEGKL